MVAVYYHCSICPTPLILREAVLWVKSITLPLFACLTLPLSLR